MILSFKTKINGKPTYFIQKIWMSLRPFSPGEFLIKMDENLLPPMYKSQYFKPKIHTIRKDEKNRWKSGVMIDFFINARQKNMFRFAPRFPVISKQRIFMTYSEHWGNGFEVSINGQKIHESEIEKLAINDGFDTVEEFEDYFIGEIEDNEYSGKIIHWTNFKY